MRIRQGFVSNSSSSSFIMAFDRLPESAQELKNILFPTRIEPVYMYGDGASVYDITNCIFDRIEGKEIGVNQIIESVKIGSIYTTYPDGRSYDTLVVPVPEYDYSRRDDAYYEEREKLENDNAFKIAMKFINENPKKVFCEAEFEDHNTLEAIIENGDIFNNIKYLKVCHH